MLYTKLYLVSILALILTACSSTPPPLDLTLTATDIAYDVGTISAKVGQTVNIEFVNDGALEHNFIVDEFGINNLLQSGSSATLSFTPQEAGTYDFYCNVAGHLEAGMMGALVVTE